MTYAAQVNIVHALERALRRQSFRLRSLSVPKANLVKSEPRAPKEFHKLPTVFETTDAKSKRVKRELLDAGVTIYGLLKSETRILPKLLHSDEHVEAVIYGQHDASSAMLVATNERIIYIDKKPMALFLDEVSYEVVSGIEFDIHLFFANVILHTPVKNYNFRFVNLHCGENFARHIEKHRLEREKQEEFQAELFPSLTHTKPRETTNEIGYEDMAGYGWLPTDEEELQKLQQVIM